MLDKPQIGMVDNITNHNMNHSSGKPETEMVNNITASIKTWTTPGKPSSQELVEILELASFMMKWSVLYTFIWIGNMYTYLNYYE
jgi:hypothetical protein